MLQYSGGRKTVYTCALGEGGGHNEEGGKTEEGGREEEDRTVTEQALISTGNWDNGNLSKNINFQANLFFLILRRNGGQREKGRREEGEREKERGRKGGREEGGRVEGGWREALTHNHIPHQGLPYKVSSLWCGLFLDADILDIRNHTKWNHPLRIMSLSTM